MMSQTYWIRDNILKGVSLKELWTLALDGDESAQNKIDKELIYQYGVNPELIVFGDVPNCGRFWNIYDVTFRKGVMKGIKGKLHEFIVPDDPNASDQELLNWLILMKDSVASTDGKTHIFIPSPAHENFVEAIRVREEKIYRVDEGSKGYMKPFKPIRRTYGWKANWYKDNNYLDRVGKMHLGLNGSIYTRSAHVSPKVNKDLLCLPQRSTLPHVMNSYYIKPKYVSKRKSSSYSICSGMLDKNESLYYIASTRVSDYHTIIIFRDKNNVIVSGKTMSAVYNIRSTSMREIMDTVLSLQKSRLDRAYTGIYNDDEVKMLIDVVNGGDTFKEQHINNGSCFDNYGIKALRGKKSTIVIRVKE